MPGLSGQERVRMCSDMVAGDKTSCIEPEQRNWVVFEEREK